MQLEPGMNQASRRGGGIVCFRAPAGATAAQTAELKDHIAALNYLLAQSCMSLTGRVSPRSVMLNKNGMPISLEAWAILVKEVQKRRVT